MRTSGDILQDMRDVQDRYENDEIDKKEFVHEIEDLKRELAAYRANTHRGPEYH